MGIPAWSKTAADNDDADADINWQEGQAPSTVNNSSRAMMAAAAEFRDDQGGALATTGSSNAYALTTNSGYAAYADGMRVTAKVNFSNTGAATLNVDTLGAKKIRKFTTAGEVALDANDLLNGSYYDFVYNAALDAAAGAFEAKPASSIQINGATALTAPAVDDELPIYDLSGTTNKKITLANVLKVIALLTAETSVAADDELVLYDTSASTADKVTVQSLYNAINVLTAETAPAVDDVIPLYDTSGTAADKITLSDLLKVINALTEDASPDTANDFVVTYDASASGPKKVKLSAIAASAATASEIWGGSATKAITVAAQVTALAEQSLTFNSSLTPNGANGINFTCTSVSSNFTLNNMSNPVIGYTYCIRFSHSAANNVASYGTDYEGINGTLPVVSTGSGDQDRMYIQYFAANRALVWLARDIS
jgi:hypothetical protein